VCHAKRPGSSYIRGGSTLYMLASCQKTVQGRMCRILMLNDRSMYTTVCKCQRCLHVVVPVPGGRYGALPLGDCQGEWGMLRGQFHQFLMSTQGGPRLTFDRGALPSVVKGVLMAWG
jgi:hypothetical protein